MNNKWIKVTDYGQLKVGSKIRFITSGELISTTVKEIQFGGTNNEEIIYDIKNNFYFILHMALVGMSHAKDLEYCADTITLPITEYEQLKADAERLETLCAWLLHRFGNNSIEGKEALYRNHQAMKDKP
jgi:hypothetical protein